MKRLCDVPQCPREGTEEVHDGWMCRWHALQWDKANEHGNVFDASEFVIASPHDDEALPRGECHSKWLGSRR